MSIDLPPTLPPQLVELDFIESHAAREQPVSVAVNGFELHVTGAHYLSEVDLRELLELAETPSQAILLIASSMARRGHLLVTTYYARQRNVVFVHALHGTVDGLEGPPAVTGYFAGLEGESELKRSQYDRARVMANVRSDRTGVDYSVSIRRDDEQPDRITLQFEGSPRDDYKPWDMTLQFGSHGSRFAGRHIADVGAGYNFGTGTRLQGNYQRAFPELGGSRDIDDFQMFQFGVDHPSRWGLYGLDANYTEHTQELGPVPVTTTTCSFALGGSCVATTSETEQAFFNLDAEIWRYGLSGEQVLSSDANYRLSLFQRLEYVDSQIEASNNLGIVQDEVYTTLELGARYQRLHALGDRRLQWGVRGGVKGGLSSDSGTLGAGADTPGPAIGKRSAEFVSVNPEAMARFFWSDWSFMELRAIGQMANEQLPQQQQWVLGGINSLAAYLPGVLVGDNGFFARGTYSYRWDLGWGRLTGSVFAEHGAAWFENVRRDPDSGIDFGSSRSVTDAGIELRLEFLENYELRAVAAESLRENNVSDTTLDRNSVDVMMVLKASF